MTKIIKIKDCVDCPHRSFNRFWGIFYCCYPLNKIQELPESGIHKKCKLEDYKVKK